MASMLGVILVAARGSVPGQKIQQSSITDSESDVSAPVIMMAMGVPCREAPATERSGPSPRKTRGATGAPPRGCHARGSGAMPQCQGR